MSEINETQTPANTPAGTPVPEKDMTQMWRYMASKKLEKPWITLEEFNQAVWKNSETVYNELSEEFKEVFQQWNRL